jgi:hypothetical protein
VPARASLAGVPTTVSASAVAPASRPPAARVRVTMVNALRITLTNTRAAP